MAGLDLYAVLHVPVNASAEQLRTAYQQRTAEARSVAERDLIRSAYAVLGDPRLRVEYDAGRVVGVGAGVYYEHRPSGPPVLRELPTVGALERRWQRRRQGIPTVHLQRLTYTSLARPFYWWFLGVVCGFFATAVAVGATR
jgi:curved DNA-binding protein CbpA